MTARSFNESYKEWRNQARKYSLDSILGSALRSLQHFESNADGVDYVRSAPWITCLIIKWVCADSMMNSRTAISDEQFDILRQRIWSFPEEMDSAIPDGGSSRLFLRQIIRPQLGFQRPASITFMRTPLILSRLDGQHRLNQMFSRRFNMRTDDFLDLTFAMFAGLMQGVRNFGTSWLSPLNHAYGETTVSNYLSLISAEIKDLKSYFQSNSGKVKKQSEMFEFPMLARFPLWKVDGTLHCWDKNMFFRSLENVVHQIMSEHGQAYSDNFSKVFEIYVIEECRSAGVEFHDEQELKRILPPGNKVPDGAFELQESTVFVESKAGIYSEPVMTAGTREIFSHKARSLVSAFAQASQAAASIRRREGHRNYLIVVTNIELSIGRGDRLRDMLPSGHLERSGYLSDAIPLERSYVASIDDFERLMSAVRNNDVELDGFLDECIYQDNDAATAVMTLGQHLDNARIPHYVSLTIEQGREMLERRLEDAFHRRTDSNA
jgi:hypothetical protein